MTNDEILALPTFEQYGIHVLVLTNWIIANPDTADKQTYRLCKKIRKMQAEYLHSFLWNGDPDNEGGYSVPGCPWIIKNGVVDLERPSPLFDDAVELIEKNCRAWRIQHRWTLAMARYNEHWFRKENNKQGIDSMWSPDGFNVYANLARRVIDIQRSVRNASYRPTFLAVNECTHNTQDPYRTKMGWSAHEFGECIARWHRALYEVFEDDLPVNRFWVNHSGSEYVHALLVGPHWDPFLKKQMGDPKYASRKVKSEDHGISTKKSLIEGNFYAGLGSGWPSLVINEDGSRDGDYRPLGGSHSYRQADAKQSRMMLRFAIRKCDEKNKQLFFVAFVLDHIKTGMEDFSNFKWNWARFRSYPNVMNEFLGEGQAYGALEGDDDDE